MNEALLSLSSSYLLALSGGGDSVALFYQLLEKGYSFEACHINHQLRGHESDLDEKFVQELCAKHCIPLTVFSTSIQSLQEETGSSLEVCARNYRHDCYRQCLQKKPHHAVLLAHHANDVAETVLMQLLRGSSGIKGIPEQTRLEDLLLIRPLLRTRKEDLLEELRSHHRSWREDLSNEEGFTPRNRLRHEALPLLSEIMNRDCIGMLAQAPRKSPDEGIRGLIDALEIQDPQGRLFLPKLKQLSQESQQQTLYYYLLDHGISQLDQATLERCCELIHQEQPSKINLPHNRALRRKEGRIFLGDQ